MRKRIKAIEATDVSDEAIRKLKKEDFSRFWETMEKTVGELWPELDCKREEA
jgi:hypothetical protein